MRARKFFNREWYPISKVMVGGEWVVRAWCWTVEGRKQFAGVRLYAAERLDRDAWDGVFAVTSPLYPDSVIPVSRHVLDSQEAAQRYAEDRLVEAVSCFAIRPMMRDAREVLASLSYDMTVLEGMMADSDRG